MAGRAKAQPMRCVALRSTCAAHAPARHHRSRQELDDMAQAYQEVRAKLDQAEGGDGLAPWRRALDG
jgi:hypothetical protein